ncbi:hypothetical protein TRICI_000202 [Trichomonascus ciferrii]|uniref:Proteasome subunit beta n=1 Tax=Trichomonascus ciferrii TaxID=44093 RepID=A0A642VDX8_9ASCO|nr:hypothetical protein TRICI_000202 [Trichomonascus ciferrii]
MQAVTEPISSAHKEPIEHRFNPYTDNGGTVLGIAGADFAILAGDTRHTSGFNIDSRFEPKLFDIGDNIAVTANGFSGDGDALVQRLSSRIKWYHHTHNKKMSLKAAARLTQHLLYGKRFFPYYVQTIMAGLDENGRGAIYSYDPVGSYERESCRAGGSAASLIMPFLDNQVKKFNQTDGEGHPLARQDLPLDEVLKLVKDSFTSATERHIHVGDYLQVLIVTKEGIETRFFDLKRD